MEQSATATRASAPTLVHSWWTSSTHRANASWAQRERWSTQAFQPGSAFSARDWSVAGTGLQSRLFADRRALGPARHWWSADATHQRSKLDVTRDAGLRGGLVLPIPRRIERRGRPWPARSSWKPRFRIRPTTKRMCARNQRAFRTRWPRRPPVRLRHEMAFISVCARISVCASLPTDASMARLSVGAARALSTKVRIGGLVRNDAATGMGRGGSAWWSGMGGDAHNSPATGHPARTGVRLPAEGQVQPSLVNPPRPLDMTRVRRPPDEAACACGQGDRDADGHSRNRGSRLARDLGVNT